MARKKTIIEEDIEDQIQVGDAGNDLSDLDEMFDTLPENESTSAWLYAVDAQGEAFMDTFKPATLFTLADVKRKYGGGKYHLMVKLGKSIKYNKRFRINGPPVLQVVADNPTPLPAADDGLRAKVATLEADLAKRQNQDILALLLKDVLAQRPAAGGVFDEDKFLDRLAKYKTILGGATGAGDPMALIKTAIETLNTLQDLNPGSKGPNPWVLALKEFREPLLELVGKFLAHPAVAGTAAALPATDGGKVRLLNEHSKTSGSQPAGEPEWMPLVRQYLPLLIGAAARDGDPGLYADMVIDNVNPAALPSLRDWLMGHSWFADLKALAPIVEAQAAWWVRLHDQLIEAIADALAGESAHESPSPAPNAGD